MKKKLGLLSFFLTALSFISLIGPSFIYSQGVNTCFYGGSTCIFGFDSCDDGYEPHIDLYTGCQIYNNDPEGCEEVEIPCIGSPSCGNLGESCCGAAPPLYCNPPNVPSSDYDPTSCFCLDPGDLTPPPEGSNCISYPPSGCPAWLPNRCTDQNTFVWCCSDMIACAEAQEPPPVSTSDRFRPDLCNYDTGRNNGIQTALGCIPARDTGQFIVWAVRNAIGLGGGIALILIIIAGLQMTTSSGDPQKLQAGKELLTSAIAGLLLIIFSVFLLELIGVRVLRIPGFG